MTLEDTVQDIPQGSTTGVASGDEDQRAVAISKRMEAYARRYAAGAYAVPLPKELATLGSQNLRELGGAFSVVKRLRTGSVRKDFTGDPIRIPAGSLVATHVTGGDESPIPDVRDVDYVFAYRDDHATIQQLRMQGFGIEAIQVSAASEMKACMKRSRFVRTYPFDDRKYAPEDAASLVRLDLPMTGEHQAAILNEVTGTSGWYDDFPYYSDGSWDAVSLRGFDREDPTMRVKPSEMGKSWWAAHPEAATRWAQCEWTVLADKMPATRALVEGLGFAGLERVGLLRMQGRDGKGGILRRHTDVTDKTMGTRDGQIIRFFIPVVTDPRNSTATWNLRGVKVEQHLEPWSLWYLDARKPHAVYNRSGLDRIHLSFDAVADEGAREALRRGHDVAQ